MNKPSDLKNISCIILAGGEGKRVGGVDKGLLKYKNKTLIKHVINAVKPQVNELIISANRNIKQYKQYADKVVADESKKYLGPLAGINAALPHCIHDWILVVPCDTPFLPKNIIEKFSPDKTSSETTLSKKMRTNLYVAESNKKLQPVMLMHKTLHNSITHSLNDKQLRLMFWAKSQQPAIINFPDKTAFKNFNNNDDFNQ